MFDKFYLILFISFVIYLKKKKEKQTLILIFNHKQRSTFFFYSDHHNKLIVYIGQSLVSKPKNEMATRTTDEREVEHGR